MIIDTEEIKLFSKAIFEYRTKEFLVNFSKFSCTIWKISIFMSYFMKNNALYYHEFQTFSLVWGQCAIDLFGKVFYNFASAKNIEGKGVFSIISGQEKAFDNAMTNIIPYCDSLGFQRKYHLIII